MSVDTRTVDRKLGSFGWLSRWAWMIPAIVTAAGAPARQEWAHSIRAPLNIYDEGLFLTMARFTSLDRLPYRDFWTLYGPGTSVMGPFVDLVAGRTVLAYRLANLVILGLLVVGIFKVVQRYAGTPLALAASCFFATISIPQFHLVRAAALVLWGLYLLHPRPGPRPLRWLPFGAFLIGCSFLGRWEFSILSLGFMAVLWVVLRRRIDATTLRRTLLAGSVPPVLFIAYLMAFVPMQALIENFYRYPFDLYPRIGCRGQTPTLRPTLTALARPLEGHVWSGDDLVLIFGNLITPVAALIAIGSRWRTWRDRGPADVAVLGLGLFALAVWMEMQPNYAYGNYPSPALPLGLSALSLAIPARKLPAIGSRVARAVTIGILVTGTLISWLPGLGPSYRDWPDHTRLYGYTDRSGQYDPALIDPMVHHVQSLTDPGDPIFVALNNNQGHYANAPTLYWLLDRPPATRYFEFNPCLTDRNDIQRVIVRDLKDTEVVVTTTFYPAPPPFGVPGTVLDDYLAEHFRLSAEFPFPETTGGFRHVYRVMVRERSG